MINGAKYPINTTISPIPYPRESIEVTIHVKKAISNETNPIVVAVS